MQTRTRNALVMGGSAVVAAAALGFLAHARKAPDLASHALDAIPSGALVVASADLTALRASPAGAPFLREGREIPGLGKVKDVCGYDPMDTLTEAAIAIPAAGEAGEFGLVASGPIDDEALVTCAAKVIEARGGRPVVTTVGTFRSVRDASMAITGGEIAVRKGGPLLLGAGAYLRAMIDTADGRAPGIRSSRAHTFLSKEIGDASVRVTAVLSPDLRRSLADELDSAGAADSPMRSIVAGGMGVKLGPKVGLHLLISCDDAAACSKVASSLDDRRRALASEMGTRLTGFNTVLEQLEIKPEGETLHARVEIPVDHATTLVERLITLRGIRHPMPKDAPTAAPAAPPAPPPKPDEVITPKGDAGKH